jgi:excisionase family DNA binding protein
MAHDLIGTAEVARVLGKSTRTVHRMVADGRLTPTMIAPGGYVGTWLFDRAEIEALAAERVA